jgi:serine carboxypeptidase-like clade 4
MTLQASNLLYVDQPTGTGFSYTSDKRDIRHNEDGVSNDLYDFLQVCLSILNQYRYDGYIIQ